MRTVWTVLLDFGEVHKQMEQFINHMSSLKSSELRFSLCLWEPSIDIYETKDDLVVLAELAGLDKSMVRVTIDGRILRIAGERRRMEDEVVKYHRMEICFGKFERVIELPVPVDPDRGYVTQEGGFLKIVLPKSSPKVRHIEIE